MLFPATKRWFSAAPRLRCLLAIFTLSLPLLVVKPSIADDGFQELIGPNHDLVSGVVSLIDGENYNLRTGELSYYREDFNIPGNGLPIRLGRSFFGRQYYYDERDDDRWPAGMGSFGNMSLEVPRIEFYAARGNFEPDALCAGPRNICNRPDSYIPTPGICAGLNHLKAGEYRRVNQQVYNWFYDRQDLQSGIRLYINNRRINFFTREGYQAGDRFPNEADYVSPSNWYVVCTGEGGENGEIWEVHSPEGVVYRMGHYGARNPKDFPQINPFQIGGFKIFVYATSVTDQYGNTLNYHYSPRLDAISASDGRRLNIDYHSDGRIKAVYDNSTNQRRLDYSYNGEQLHRVTQRDGTYWQYAYEFKSTQGVGRVIYARDLLTSVKTPTGTQINYHYYPYFQNYREEFEYGFQLQTRTVSGPSLPTGMTWSYSYHVEGGNKISTFIRGPSSSQQYTHRPLVLKTNQTHRSWPHDAGRLLSHRIFPPGTAYGASTAALKQTDYSWIRRPGVISDSALDEGYIHSDLSIGDIVYRLPTRMYAYAASMQKVPASITRTVDGRTFTQTFNNYDIYDNHRQVVESGNAGSRTTNYTYHNDTNNWVIGNLKNETVVNAGAGIVRTYHTSNSNRGAIGKLRTEKQYGLATRNYRYNNDGLLEEIYWNRNGTTIREKFENYYRGIPRKETDPEGHSLNRIVNDDGTVRQEIDRNGKTVKYSYDNRHRLSRIDTPFMVIPR